MGFELTTLSYDHDGAADDDDYIIRFADKNE
jgi:hypothetical protein